MPPQSRAWPVLSGTVPYLADGYTRRTETGQGPWDALHPGLTVVIGPADEPRGSVPSAGGTGKTQLAAAYVLKLWAAGELDLLVWLEASGRDNVVRGYARALADIKVAAPPGQPEAAAARFLDWLAQTGRHWLVVLDDLAEPADLEGLWPRGPGGQTLVTTKVARLAVAGPAEAVVGVPSFSQREALNFMSTRLNGDPYQAAGSLDLALAVNCLPAGLSLAATYVLDSGQDCRQYRLACERYRQDRPDGTPGDPLAPFWMFAVDRARQFAPRELAWPAIKLAAVLGPAWIPGAVLTSSAACAYATGRQHVTSADQASLRAAFGNLQRFGLVMIEPDDEVRTIGMAGAVQASIRRAMAPAELRQAVLAAADAVYEAWPESRGHGRPAALTAGVDLTAADLAGAGLAGAGLEQALRDCAASLRRCDDVVLWSQGCHPLLVRVAQSLNDAGLPQTALGYWRNLARCAADYLGARSPLTLELRERLAGAAAAAGRGDEAVTMRAELAAVIDEVAGPTHPQAVIARANLAVALRAAGRLADAMTLGQRVVAESELAFGQAHAQTTASLAELGSAYADAWRYPEAIGVFGRCLGLREQTIGLMHQDTVAARRHLAQAYGRADRANEAIRLYAEALARLEHSVGAIHPDALATRESLAIITYQAGRADEAAVIFERTIADWLRIPGAGPAQTLATRANLAAIYCLSGRLKEAIALYEANLADLERVRGPAQPDILRARWNLAAAYHKAKRLPEAVQLGEATLGDCEQMLGPGHWETLTTRANLAHAYHAAGQLKRASAQFDRALRDSERALPPDDPLTEKIRALRKRYLAGRQGAAPIIAPPATTS
jgi:tetratricopeptide (TPR) repeat protein